MILEMDLGNTRIKWRLSTGAAVEGVGVCEYQGLASLIMPEGITRVRVSSVASAQRCSELIAWCREMLRIEPEFAQVTDRCGGVVCAYSKPETLGVDRWMALLAVYKQYSGAAIVVDCGTAITVDVLAHDGGHCGGYILPGFNLMLRSLGGATASVQVSGVGATGDLALGSTTAECVLNGVLMSVVSLIRGLQSAEPAAVIIITGGAGQRLLPYFAAAEWKELLVLDGLEVALP